MIQEPKILLKSEKKIDLKTEKKRNGPHGGQRGVSALKTPVLSAVILS